MDNYINEECGYYFLTETAVAAWTNNDNHTQNEMLLCITKLHKENWFKSVIYKNGFLAEWKLKEFAENAFLFSWEKFNEDGMAGRSNVQSKEYTNYLYKMFRNTFLKTLEKARKNTTDEKFFGIEEVTTSSASEETEAREITITITRKVLAMMEDNCVEIIGWRYLKKLSFDEIARRKGIKRESCIQSLWRCKKQFIELYVNNKNKQE